MTLRSTIHLTGVRRRQVRVRNGRVYVVLDVVVDVVRHEEPQQQRVAQVGPRGGLRRGQVRDLHTSAAIVNSYCSHTVVATGASWLSPCF